MEIIYCKGLPNGAELFSFYAEMGWNKFLKLDAEVLQQAMQNSYFVMGAYASEHLVGMGRVISDGVMNAYLCGLGVLPEYRNQGIGRKITGMLLAHCQEAKLHVQFFCEEDLLTFYEAQGFERFAIGMRVKD